MSGAWPDWPPEAGDTWVVHGTMGAPVNGLDADGAGAYVLLRIGARRNLGDDQDDRTYVLGVTEAASILSGIISMGNLAWGRDALQDAMAAALHMTDEDRRAAAREAARRLAEDAPPATPSWLHEEPDGFRIVDRD